MSSDIIPVKVYVRARPFNKREKAENASQCLQFFVESNQVQCNSKMFAFDSVMDASTSQSTAFELTTGDIIEKLLNGFNCTIIAYGQTGSGKTFSMGTEETTQSMQSESRGIIPRLVEKLFSTVSSSEHSTAFSVYVSMLEIYDEKVNDLLSNVKDLQVREANGSVLVQGLKRESVSTLAETMQQLEIGCQLRSKGETAMNAKSSRSHAIFTIAVDKAAVDETDSGFKAKLHLVDLAGSERLKKTQAEGERMREGININQGLLALGNVISALSESNGSKHIPYRDSKITRLLQDSLGGNSYTVMIACVSPADSNAEETMSTLRYADRAKKIKNKPVVNEDAEQASAIRALQEKVRRLEKQLAEKVVAEGGTDSCIRSVEYQKLQEELADCQKTIEDYQSKAAEACYQKVALHRQLTKLETEKEQLRSVVSRDDIDEEKAVAILRDIRNMFDAEVANKTADETAIAKKEGDEEEMDVEEEVDEAFGAHYLSRQTQLEDEMKEIAEQLMRRQKIVLDTNADKERLEKMMEDQKMEKERLQEKLDQLQAEYAKLQADLKKCSTSGKLAEERRQKVKELEKMISAYKKQISDLKRLEKQKAELDEKARKMTGEIQLLKQAQVQNQKKAKEVADQYRVQKAKHERQMAQMKAQERKKEVAFVRKERENERKMDVLRKKLEESARINKRLIAYQNKRTQLAEENAKDLPKNIKQFLKQELAGHLDFRTATRHYEALVESRRTSSSLADKAKKHLKRARKQREEEEAKGHQDNVAYFEEKIENLEKEIAEKEAEVKKATEMLETLGDQKTQYDPEVRADERWKNVKTVSHAKQILNLVFDMLVDTAETAETDREALNADIAEKKAKITEQNMAKKQADARYKKNLEEILEETDEWKRQLSEQMISLSASLKTSSTEEGISRLEKLNQELTAAASNIDGKIDDALSGEPIARSSRQHKKVNYYGNVVNSETMIPPTPVLDRMAKRSMRIMDQLSPIPKEGRKRRDSNLFEKGPLKAANSSPGRNENMNVTFNVDDENAAAANATFVCHNNDTFVRSPGKRTSDASNAEAPPMKIKHQLERTLGGLP